MRTERDRRLARINAPRQRQQALVANSTPKDKAVTPVNQTATVPFYMFLLDHPESELHVYLCRGDLADMSVCLAWQDQRRKFGNGSSLPANIQTALKAFERHVWDVKGPAQALANLVDLNVVIIQQPEASEAEIITTVFSPAAKVAPLTQPKKSWWQRLWQ